MITYLDGSFEIYGKSSSERRGPISLLDDYLSLRDMDYRLSLGLGPVGTDISDFLEKGAIESYLTEGKLVSLKTREGFYIYIQNSYLFQERGNRKILVDLPVLKESFCDYLYDTELQELTFKESQHFVNVFKNLAKETSYKLVGSSIVLKDFDQNGFVEYMKEIYGLDLKLAKLGNDTKLNFINNRSNPIYIDPGILAVVVSNFMEGIKIKMKGL